MAEYVTYFKAPWSPLLSVITVFTIVLLTVCFIGSPFIIFVEGGRQALLPIVLSWTVTIGFLVWVFRTQFIQNYVLSGDRLIIERFGSNTEFSLTNLESVQEDPTAMDWIYAMPNGGLFAFAGKKCRNRKLGVFEVYATDKKRSVVLRFPNHVLVVTPDDPAVFIEAIKSRTSLHEKSKDD